MAIPAPWRANPHLETKEAGQAWVYPVLHPEYDGEFALKLLKNPKRKDRFEREIASMRQLGEAGVAVLPVLATGEDERGRPFYVMPWCHRGSMEDQSLASSTDRDEVLRRLDELAAALQGCHSAMIAHRDLKPANLLIGDDGRLVLADLGLALGPEDDRYTETEEAIGSRHYIAPENESGLNEDNDQRPADAYAFGKILWVMVTGRTVLAREQQLEPHRRMAVVLEDPSLAPLDALCDRLLDRDPRSRLADWVAIRSELAAIMSPEGGRANGTPHDESWSASASAGLQRFAALADTRARAEARRRETLRHERWQAVTSAMQIRFGELMDSRLAELTDQAETLLLAFRRSIGGPQLTNLLHLPPMSHFASADLPTWVRNEGSQALFTASGTEEPAPSSLYVGHYVLPIDDHVVFVRLPIVYIFPGARLHVPQAASSYAGVVHGPTLGLESAVTAAQAFADESSVVAGRMLVRYIEALVDGEDVAEVFK